MIEKVYLEKTDKTTENCFISPAVKTIKKDELVKIALDSKELKKSCIKRNAAMANMEELLGKISAVITKTGAKYGCQKLTWCMHTVKTNCPERRQNIGYSQSSGATSRDTTDSRKVSTDYRIFHRVPRTHRQGTGIKNTCLAR